MAFKMKGNPFQRNYPDYIKPAPTKWINFVIQGISAIANASKKDKERREQKLAEAKAAMEGGTAGAGGEQPKPTDAVKMKDARKVEKFEAKPLDTEKPLKK
tara:strand:- start:13 stop:315 length:303 start_codon:yes stop_codon:yes gene_type:complete